MENQETNSLKTKDTKKTSPSNIVGLLALTGLIFVTVIAGVLLYTQVINKNDKQNENQANNTQQTQQVSKPEPFDAENLAQANNEFTFKMINQLSKESDTNLFISPTSIELALLMTLNGADGETANETKLALQASDIDIDTLNKESENIMQIFNQTQEGLEVSIANSLWGRDDVEFKQTFLDIAQDSYDAEVRSVDLKDPAVVDDINIWIEEKTNDKIKDMLNEIDEDAVLMLINAIYFNGTWQYEFNSDLTETDTFTKIDASEAEVEMMKYEKSENFRYYTDGEVEFLELPYSGEEYAMYVLLPEANNINEVVSNLDQEKWSDLVSNLSYEEGTALLPKFKFETETMTLNSYLKNLGMKLAFTPGDSTGCVADFSKMSKAATEDCWYVNRVLHKAFVDVNEEGTEAAAATVVEMRETTAVETDPDPVYYFDADHPFFYAIAEKESGMIMFAGIVNEPRYAE